MENTNVQTALSLYTYECWIINEHQTAENLKKSCRTQTYHGCIFYSREHILKKTQICLTTKNSPAFTQPDTIFIQFNVVILSIFVSRKTTWILKFISLEIIFSIAVVWENQYSVYRWHDRETNYEFQTFYH